MTEITPSCKLHIKPFRDLFTVDYEVTLITETAFLEEISFKASCTTLENLKNILTTLSKSEIKMVIENDPMCNNPDCTCKVKEC